MTTARVPPSGRRPRTPRRWVDTEDAGAGAAAPNRVHWLRAAPFVALRAHVLRLFAMTTRHHHHFPQHALRTPRARARARRAPER